MTADGLELGKAEPEAGRCLLSTNQAVGQRGHQHWLLGYGLQGAQPDVSWVPRVLESAYVMVVVPQPDADGAARSGDGRCHRVQIDNHIRHALQHQLLLHDCLEEETFHELVV